MASKNKPVAELTYTSNLPDVLSQTEQAINRKLRAMADVSRLKLLTEVLVGQRDGNEYPLPDSKTKPPKTWRASKPGEAPASRLGDLRRSYKVGSIEGQGLDKTIKLGSQVPYSVWLEFGTKRMAERPHLRPAMRLSKPEHEEILRGDWGF